MQETNFKFIESCCVEIKNKPFIKTALYDMFSHSIFVVYNKFDENFYADLLSIPFGTDFNDRVVFSLSNGKVKIKIV